MAWVGMLMLVSGVVVSMARLPHLEIDEVAASRATSSAEDG